MKVKDLSVDELKTLIGEILEEKLREILGDPDSGLEVRPEMAQRLRKSLAALERGEQGIPLEEVAQRLGLGL